MHDLSLYLMAAFYFFAGVSHFRKSKFFLKITPLWVLYPVKVNWVVGAIEIGLAIMLVIPMLKTLGALGIIVLLFLVFPANWYHYQLAKKKGKHVLPTLIRLPMQIILIYWAYSFIG